MIPLVRFRLSTLQLATFPAFEATSTSNINRYQISSHTDSFARRPCWTTCISIANHSSRRVASRGPFAFLAFWFPVLLVLVLLVLFLLLDWSSGSSSRITTWSLIIIFRRCHVVICIWLFMWLCRRWCRLLLRWTNLRATSPPTKIFRIDTSYLRLAIRMTMLLGLLLGIYILNFDGVLTCNI